MTETIDGKLLLAWGIEPGPTFKLALAQARQLAAEGLKLDVIKDRLVVAFPRPAVIARVAPRPFGEAIAGETSEDEANIAQVRKHMAELMRCPVIEAGAIMPDACPSSSALGTIPVGGAVASRGIHPAFHSADICCSMYATVVPAGTDASAFMDAIQAATRFGPGSRPVADRVVDRVTDELEGTRNPFLVGLADKAKAQLADQGDGNHFAYLGGLEVTSALKAAFENNGQSDLAAALGNHTRVDVLVTHHGSRELGAHVYKRGLAEAVRHVAKLSPETPPQQAWLDPDSSTGAAYWAALQYVARWTRRNHQLVHERTLTRLGITPLAAFGNEHNFVWRRTDGLYYHGKGATPAWTDAAGHPLLGLIPLNMAQPILVTLGRANERYAGFSPHGAGRNKSRTALLREVGLDGLLPEAFLERSRALVDEQTAGLDIRFFYDRPDVSESPMAYKNAAQVQAQIAHFGLADVVGLIQPKGCIMAGDYDKPWMRKKRS